ncbi:hypothetical protein SSTU70S_01536 [Stutzerimonas stutzeri]
MIGGWRACYDLELPGIQLFQYLDDDGQRHTVGSGDINQYLRDLTGRDFTAKDYHRGTGPAARWRWSTCAHGDGRPRTRRANSWSRR